MTQSASTSVNTKKVTNRRKLHFNSLEEALADAGRVAEAARAGTLRQLGNWDPSQCFDHLATWSDYAFDGVPFKPPLILRLIGPLIKGIVLKRGIPAGGRLPKVPGGTLAFERGPIDAAMAHLEKSFGRLSRETPPLPNPIFGKMTHEQWIALHCRHSELHLGFFELSPKK